MKWVRLFSVFLISLVLSTAPARAAQTTCDIDLVSQQGGYYVWKLTGTAWFDSAGADTQQAVIDWNDVKGCPFATYVESTGKNIIHVTWMTVYDSTDVDSVRLELQTSGDGITSTNTLAFTTKTSYITVSAFGTIASQSAGLILDATRSRENAFTIPGGRFWRVRMILKDPGAGAGVVGRSIRTYVFVPKISC